MIVEETGFSKEQSFADIYFVPKEKKRKITKKRKEISTFGEFSTRVSS